MQVAKNSVVTLKYTVTDPDGAVVDEGQEALSTSTADTKTSSRRSRKPLTARA